MISVFICDDQHIVCEGLQTILRASPEIEVLGTAHDGSVALEMLEQIQPDVVLMDLKMPIMNGIIATRKIRQKYPEVRVLVLTTYDDDEWIFDAIRSGAAGYLLKDTPPENLIAAILGTAAGKTFLDPDIAGRITASYRQQAPASTTPSNLQFSPRELDILSLLAQGLSNADIAQQLYLSEGTVRNYTSEIFKKMGVSDRTQAAVLALRYGLVRGT
ncbi:MAG: response regulator transcription factor [Chloroflexi bacterium]|jgi:DNA-binding NarL/FixJ family response regulator|nr:response regulator transcription factor [Chloroflexota bacterium]